MDRFNFPDSVESVCGASGQLIYKKKARKKRGAPVLRQIDGVVRGALHAQRDFNGAYESAHDASKFEKRDGWLLDLPRNLGKAGRKAMRKLLRRI